MTTQTLEQARGIHFEQAWKTRLDEDNSHLAIMFTDIEGSTRMIEELGDETALALLIEHHSIVRNQVAAHLGREVKNLGDGFLLAFPSAVDAIDCATAIQRSLNDFNKSGPPRPVRVRCGITVGEPLRHGHDLSGRCVVLASRIVNEARGEQILVSSELKDEVGPSTDVTFGRGREFQAKGLRGTQSVFEVNWKLALGDDSAHEENGKQQADSSVCCPTEVTARLLPRRMGGTSGPEEKRDAKFISPTSI